VRTFYYLNVCPVNVPPLGESSEDIFTPGAAFAQQFSRRMNKPIDTTPFETLQALVRHHSIRELQTEIERAVTYPLGPFLDLPLSS
jgi:transcriptional regulator with GAF, ATPase, and Fis domain